MKGHAPRRRHARERAYNKYYINIITLTVCQTIMHNGSCVCVCVST